MITLLDPASYRSTPWKNGRGTTVDIAYSGESWRFGRTPIVEPGPFSDYTGYDRVQTLVAGAAALCWRRRVGRSTSASPSGPCASPARPHRQPPGGGPVEVVNLIGARAEVAIDMAVLDEGHTLNLQPGIHIAYNPRGDVLVAVQGSERPIGPDYSLRLELTGPLRLTGLAGCLLVASILNVT